MKRHAFFGVKWFVIIAALLLVFLFSAKHIFLWDGLYFNNKKFNRDTNREIKHVVLEAIGDRCLRWDHTDLNNIYDLSCTDQIIQFDETAQERQSVFCIIDTDFMSTVEQVENEYSVIVNIIFSENYSYHITVKFEEGHARITSFLLDI